MSFDMPTRIVMTRRSNLIAKPGPITWSSLSSTGENQRTWPGSAAEPLDEVSLSGRGTHLIKAAMDEMQYDEFRQEIS